MGKNQSFINFFAYLPLIVAMSLFNPSKKDEKSKEQKINPKKWKNAYID